MLAGNDPGPLPGLERLLCWAIGALAPALLLWRYPADIWSLLLVQTPLRARRDLQQRLSALQNALAPKLGLAVGAALALPLLWWLDRWSALASQFSPLAGSPRLVDLLLASMLLAVMLWQWQQLLQALWLLSRSPAVIRATPPLDQPELERSRLCLGLPLLLPDPLQINPPLHPAGPISPTAVAGAGAAGSAVAAPPSRSVDAGSLAAVAVEPEQPAEEAKGPQLDEQVD